MLQRGERIIRKGRGTNGRQFGKYQFLTDPVSLQEEDIKEISLNKITHQRGNAIFFLFHSKIEF